MNKYARLFLTSIVEACGFRIRPLSQGLRGYENLLYPSLNNLEGINYIFDVGANVGQAAKLFSKNFPSSIIYSFEPINSTFEVLKKNTASLHNVKPINLALGEKEEAVEVQAIPLCTGNSLLKIDSINKSDSAPQIVDVSTVDKFAKDNGISSIGILKIDTEGYDLKVINGAIQLINNGQIDYILCEVGFSSSNPIHVPIFNFIDYLKKYKYELYGIYDLTCHPNGRVHYANALFAKQTS